MYNDILDSIYVEYQPIFDISDFNEEDFFSNIKNKIVKYEALMRFKPSPVIEKLLKSNENENPITVVINKFKEQKQEYRLTLKMLELVGSEMRENKELHNVSVNIMLNDIYKEKEITELIKKYNLQDKLTLEFLEEQELTNDIKKLSDFIDRMKQFKVKIALDDFGKGYATFAPIIKLYKYLDIIKIDEVLVTALLDETNHVVFYFMDHLIKLFERIRQTVIVEFVKSRDLCLMLSYMGVKYGQGNYLAKPMTVKEIKRRLYGE